MGKDKAITVKRADCDMVNNAFFALMNKSVQMLNDWAGKDSGLFKNATAFEIEKISTETIRKACFGTPFNPENVKLVSGQKFPDIVADNHFGIEVKTTTKNHWTSTGSSIVESTRTDDIERIYMLFGKLGGNPIEFECRPYQDVLYDITVTHSPRYLINMKLPCGDSIFDKMGIPYETLRNSEDSIKNVRHYYRQKALKEGRKEMPWWLTKDDDGGVSNMNLRMWKDVVMTEKRMLIDQMLVLFPEIINSEFDDAALWLCTTKGIINTHFRDIYTAGGKLKKINGVALDKTLPRVLFYVVNDAMTIKKLLVENCDFREFVEEFNPYLLQGKDVFGNWISQVRDILLKNSLEIPIMEWICTVSKLS